jgi:hypothetical protein
VSSADGFAKTKGKLFPVEGLIARQQEAEKPSPNFLLSHFSSHKFPAQHNLISNFMPAHRDA